MAKQKNRKSSGGISYDLPYEMAKWAFAPITSNEKISLENVEYTGVKQEKRFSAAKKYLARMMKGEEVFPGIGKPTNVDTMNFAKCCSLFLYSYDTLNRMYRITLAASIWIISAVADANRFSELLPLLADEKDIPEEYNAEYREVYIPEANPQVVKRLNWMLDACFCDGELDQYGLVRTIASDAAVKGPRRYSLEIKKILKLVPKKWIDIAVKNYKTSVSGWIGSLLKAVKTSQSVSGSSEKADLSEITASRETMESFFDAAMVRRLKRFQVFDYAALIYDPVAWKEKFPDTTTEEMAKKYGYLKPLIDFTVHNPFLYCFGFVYLLFNNDEFIWLYWLNATPLMKAAVNLPWAVATYTELQREIADSDSEAEAISLKEIAEFFSPVSRSENCEPSDNAVSTALYMTDGIVYTNDRSQSYMEYLNRIFEKFGWNDVKIVAPIALMTAAMTMMRPAETYSLMPPEKNNNQPEIQEEVPLTDEQLREEEITRQIQDLEATVKLLKRENASLRSELSSVNKKFGDVSSELEALREEADDRNFELARLREVIFPENIDSEALTQAEEEIEFPVDLNGRKIYIFGGFPTFFNELKDLIPEIKMIGPDGDPKEDAIAYADFIWFQTNCLSHKTYEKAIAAVRRYRKPFGYIDNASARKAAIQICEQSVLK